MSREDEFTDLRPLLFAIAYRILGSVTEAEDAVQETWLRWHRSDVEPASTKAYLSAVVTRIAIDVLRSARVRREEYPGPWFPEPLVDDPYEDPARSAELADSVSMAALVLLERLSPLERAVFVLRDVFGFSFSEIATTVERSEDACRQLASRARRHMSDGRPRFEADRRVATELAARFFDAVRVGDVDGLRELLAADAVMIADAGGKAPLWGKGRFVGESLVRLIAGVAPSFVSVGATIEAAVINHQPGAVMRDADGAIAGTWSLEIADGHIQTIRTILNPDKLHHLGEHVDSWALFRAAMAKRHDGSS